MSKGNYEIAKDLEALAVEVIRERPDLSVISENGLSIAFIRSDVKKKGKNKIIFADCRKVSEVYTAFIHYDFIITFYEPNVALLDEDKIKVLMWHELKHCGVDEKGNPYVVPHDIEDFSCIIKEYGLGWNIPKETE